MADKKDLSKSNLQKSVYSSSAANLPSPRTSYSATSAKDTDQSTGHSNDGYKKTQTLSRSRINKSK